jgi:hypothetical protein
MKNFQTDHHQASTELHYQFTSDVGLVDIPVPVSTIDIAQCSTRVASSRPAFPATSAQTHDHFDTFNGKKQKYTIFMLFNVFQQLTDISKYRISQYLKLLENSTEVVPNMLTKF